MIQKTGKTFVDKLQHKYMMPSGSTTELDGYWKKKYEKFFGVQLPKIKIHKTYNSIKKADKYSAKSYAQGNDIYLGCDSKSIDTLEGQATIAHEITHVLQQKYLDMSSKKGMIDPSIELERKAQVVEDRVKSKKGIEESSKGYFQKWNVLPSKIYFKRSLITTEEKTESNTFLQRKSLSFKEKKSKANITENKFNNFFKKGGWKNIEGQIGTQGIDGLHYKVDKEGNVKDVLIIEAKYSSSRRNITNSLLKKTNHGKQLSQGWNEKKLRNLLKKNKDNKTYKQIYKSIQERNYTTKLVGSVEDKGEIKNYNKLVQQIGYRDTNIRFSKIKNKKPTDLFYKFTDRYRHREVNKFLKKDLLHNQAGHKNSKVTALRDNVFQNSMENKYNNDLSKAIGSFGNLYEAKKLSVDGRTKEGRLYKKRSKQLCKYAGKLDIANKHKGVLLGLVSEGMYAANNVDYGLANYLDLGKGMVDEVGSLAEDLGISKKYLDHKRFKALSNKIGVGTSLMGLGKSVNNVFDGDVTMQDGLNVAHGALGTITSVQNTKIGKKLLNKIPKLNKMIGKGRKFLGFIQKIVGVIDSGILSNPFKFASIAADAIGGFITNITGQIGGKVIASTIAAVTGGLGALLYPVTSYFGDMLVSWGITSLYNRYAKPPILQRIQIFAQKSLGSIEKNYPILAHLINGRYMSFFKGMLSYINPKAIFNFIDSFMSKKFPVVWSGVKKASEFLGNVIGSNIRAVKNVGSSIVKGIKSGWNITKSIGVSIGKSIGSGAKKSWNFAKTIDSKAILGVSKIAKKSINFASKVAKKSWNKVKNVGSAVVSDVKSIGKGVTKVASKALNFASNIAKKSFGFVSGLFGSSSKKKSEKEDSGSIWDSFKFATIDRKQNKQVEPVSTTTKQSQFDDYLQEVRDNKYEISQKMMRDLQNEIKIELARAG